jgi:hypothetical protein
MRQLEVIMESALYCCLLLIALGSFSLCKWIVHRPNCQSWISVRNIDAVTTTRHLNEIAPVPEKNLTRTMGAGFGGYG